MHHCDIGFSCSQPLYDLPYFDEFDFEYEWTASDETLKFGCLLNDETCCDYECWWFDATLVADPQIELVL